MQRKGNRMLGLQVVAKIAWLTAAGWFFTTCGCNAYNLDSKISSALQNSSALSLDTSAFSDLLFGNTSVTRDVSTYVSGGTKPYNITLGMSGTIAAELLITISGSTITTGRNTASAPPSSTAIILTLPTISYSITDAAGAVITGSAQAKLRYKRVFITKDTVTGDFNNWNSGGTLDYSSCNSAEPVDRANCRCNLAAQQVKLPNASKYRAWLSDANVIASCNLIGQLSSTCVTPGQFAGGPWYNMGNNLVAASFGTAVTAGNVGLYNTTGITNSIQYQQDGLAGTSFAWSGTTSAGAYDATATQNCLNWTSGTSGSVGNTTATLSSGAPYWYGTGTQSCTGGTAGFYCFETD